MVRSLHELRIEALDYGATDFGLSTRTNKMYYVVVNGRKVHFGTRNYDYGDEVKFDAWVKRNKEPSTRNDPTLPSYWIHYLLGP